MGGVSTASCIPGTPACLGPTPSFPFSALTLFLRPNPNDTEPRVSHSSHALGSVSHGISYGLNSVHPRYGVPRGPDRGAEQGAPGPGQWPGGDHHLLLTLGCSGSSRGRHRACVQHRPQPGLPAWLPAEVSGIPAGSPVPAESQRVTEKVSSRLRGEEMPVALPVLLREAPSAWAPAAPPLSAVLRTSGF